jgi:hypothetical protein
VVCNNEIGIKAKKLQSEERIAFFGHNQSKFLAETGGNRHVKSAFRAQVIGWRSDVQIKNRGGQVPDGQGGRTLLVRLANSLLKTSSSNGEGLAEWLR